MAGAKEIKTRIKSIQSTHQITKAMEIVSTTKFRKFSALVIKSRPFADTINNILSNIAAGIKAEKHPLFDGREEVKKIGVIVMTSDTGLCGSFNHATLKELEKIRKRNSGKEVSVIAIGRKGRDYCKKRDYDLKATYIQLIPEVMGQKAEEISENIVEYYYDNIFDEVYVIYNKFVSALRSDLVVKRLIPIERVEAKDNTPYIFEPDAETILSALLPKYLNVEIYQALLNNAASEHSARKNSMKNATDNAEDMLKMLNLKYNRERQAAITQEITEIVGGAAALN
ncbi:ATP synthase gamma chain, sodium ion specific [Fusobacterium sp. DD29]|uniref:ATP synthase F1 subunit gamma n=1 Tax=unclassified Fusobacterium TaxID=2648384 RepID=UPI001B8C7603|nr:MULTISPECIES: ATP synthase F1 subunit gamma [unclassified Fusobacterium]MBR8700875.1 ATP synthase gamma chain, sodium ion specific [Fusobacterium sp. DD45]MBR8710661.1 ATP synthase gamma chain, sodium ion specific [Fusobacterium sp. DD28]MBR8748840.1 ATP synthase gamma chain, sodium ion specific [Fusobacterium sp. DD29]MBR8751225.1 ATP synthase gamma chain, sodium ion specific [Fusobacterium sp. DD26]MBR8761107.1 ATP synthase gamma chain, sodium ion specific [Fusobacterium sp. DD25]